MSLLLRRDGNDFREEEDEGRKDVRLSCESDDDNDDDDADGRYDNMLWEYLFMALLGRKAPSTTPTPLKAARSPLLMHSQNAKQKEKAVEIMVCIVDVIIRISVAGSFFTYSLVDLFY